LSGEKPAIAGDHTEAIRFLGNGPLVLLTAFTAAPMLADSLSGPAILAETIEAAGRNFKHKLRQSAELRPIELVQFVRWMIG
jgi:hypothetical protein